MGMDRLYVACPRDEPREARMCKALLKICAFSGNAPKYDPLRWFLTVRCNAEVAFARAAVQVAQRDRRNAVQCAKKELETWKLSLQALTLERKKLRGDRDAVSDIACPDEARFLLRQMEAGMVAVRERWEWLELQEAEDEARREAEAAAARHRASLEDHCDSDELVIMPDTPEGSGDEEGEEGDGEGASAAAAGDA